MSTESQEERDEISARNILRLLVTEAIQKRRMTTEEAVIAMRIIDLEESKPDA